MSFGLTFVKRKEGCWRKAHGSEIGFRFICNSFLLVHNKKGFNIWSGIISWPLQTTLNTWRNMHTLYGKANKFIMILGRQIITFNINLLLGGFMWTHWTYYWCGFMGSWWTWWQLYKCVSNFVDQLLCQLIFFNCTTFFKLCVVAMSLI